MCCYLNVHFQGQKVKYGHEGNLANARAFPFAVNPWCGLVPLRVGLCVYPSTCPKKLLTFQCRKLPCYEIRSSVSLRHPRILCSWMKMISSRDSARLVAGRSGVWIMVGASKLFACLKCPDRLSGPTSLLFSGYHGLFPQGESGRGVMLTTNLHLAPRLRTSGAVGLCLTDFIHFNYVVRHHFILPSMSLCVCVCVCVCVRVRATVMRQKWYVTDRVVPVA